MITGIRKTIIEGFPNYEINEMGGIAPLRSYIEEYNVFTEEIKTRIDRAGYLTVRLSHEGKTFTKYLHRLLAENFIPNPEGKLFVNHKNGIKTDNSLQNLEWSTQAENTKHAYESGLIKNKSLFCKRVIDVKTGQVFNSVREASEVCCIPYSTLKNSLNGNRNNSTSLLYLSTTT